MKDDATPSCSQEIADLPNWDRSFWLSRAYIEASYCLCESMLRGDFSSQYSSSRVILHLARQGIELFLKAAIGAIGGESPHGHNLEKLNLEYWRLYPDQSFHFQLPSRYRIDPTPDLFPDISGLFHATLDQRHRYAEDKIGNSFATDEVFDPVFVLEEIQELRRVFTVLEIAKIKPALGYDMWKAT